MSVTCGEILERNSSNHEKVKIRTLNQNIKANEDKEHTICRVDKSFAD